VGALSDLINDAISTDPIKTQLESLGFQPKRMGLADLAAYVTGEQAMWKEQVEIARIASQY
jgi:tripartite-type tricarboxylate transporter receptor subunit TctC